MKTGYFASQKRPRTRTKTHIVNMHNKPLCGTRIANYNEFHWCGNGAAFTVLECKMCSEIARKKIIKEVEQLGKDKK